MKRIIHLICGAGLLFLCTACGKDFLEKKADKALLIPETLADLQAMLDNYAVMNQAPLFNEIASGDNYTTEAGFLAISAIEQIAYTWSKDIYPASIADWTNLYVQIQYANIVLEVLEKTERTAFNQKDYDFVRGSALFSRAHALYQLSQSFMEPYKAANADQAPGIPVPLTSDVNVRPGRGSVRKTYNQITADLTEAAALLPETVMYKSRPCKGAALGLLARMYLAMADYEKAEYFATACLNIQSGLLDYSTLNSTVNKPFPPPLPNANEEVLFYSFMVTYSFGSNITTMVDSMLYRSYNANDLRKVLFFNDRGKGVITFKGSYAGTASTTFFAGVAIDEVYLVRAECKARKGDSAGALSDLNKLLITRFKKNTYVPYTASTAEAALNIVLTERRKELLFRGLRWTDLRRLNQEPGRAITLKRVLGTQEYTLPPNDPRYVLAIPSNEIQASGIAQNPRE